MIKKEGVEQLESSLVFSHLTVLISGPAVPDHPHSLKVTTQRRKRYYKVGI